MMIGQTLNELLLTRFYGIGDKIAIILKQRLPYYGH